MNYLRPELLDQLAAAYVLGTLRGPARRRFERLCRHSNLAQQAVQAWETQLTPLAASVAPIEPPAQLWPRIAAQLGHIEAAAHHRWRWLSPALSFAAGLVLAVGLLQLYPGLLPTQKAATANMPVSATTGLPASYVGLLLDADNKPAILASAPRRGKTLSFKLLQPLQVPADKVAVVWALSKNDQPTRLGTLPRSGKLAFDMDNTAEALLSETAKLGVSFEDPAAAERVAHPGKLVLSGHCVKLW